MKIIRGFLVILSFIIFGLGSLFVGICIFPIIKIRIKDEHERLMAYSKTVYSTWNWFVRLIQSMKIIKLDIKNPEKFHSIKNSLIVSTHPSYIDVLIILSQIPNTTCYVAPRLTQNEFFKNIVESMFLISGKSLDELHNDSKYMFDHGFNILIFPSGIRHRKNERPKIRKGASLIALNSKRDIVPVTMSTNFDFLQIGQPIYDAGSDTVVYDIECGDEIKIDEFLKYGDEVLQRKDLTEQIAKSLYEL